MGSGKSAAGDRAEVGVPAGAGRGEGRQGGEGTAGGTDGIVMRLYGRPA